MESRNIIENYTESTYDEFDGKGDKVHEKDTFY
jgi:hypothetical protein